MKAPRTLVVILAIYFLLKVLTAVLTGQIYALAPLAVWSIAGWKAYKGSQTAAGVLVVLFVLGAAFTTYGTMVASGLHPIDVGFNYGYVVFLAASAAYLLLSRKLKAFQESSGVGAYGR
ncbi:hypothetical protein [Solimonas aquatica]|uniref:hypothetical protein n=1 Tax=Solimonas aquatica TaxID=489703 RepID=UPI001160C344|nr:hypothetical protein [Solimonas aquatica]